METSLWPHLVSFCHQCEFSCGVSRNSPSFSVLPARILVGQPHNLVSQRESPMTFSLYPGFVALLQLNVWLEITADRLFRAEFSHEMLVQHDVRDTSYASKYISSTSSAFPRLTWVFPRIALRVRVSNTRHLTASFWLVLMILPLFINILAKPRPRSFSPSLEDGDLQMHVLFV